MLLAHASPSESRAGPGNLPLVLWPAALTMWGPGEQSRAHAHHALHLALCRQGTLALQQEGAATSEHVAAVLVGPDVTHALDARGSELLLFFVEPESQDGERLLGALAGQPVRTFDAAQRDALLGELAAPGPLAPEAVSRWMRATVDALAAQPHAAPRRMHPRVRRLLRALRREPPPEDTSLEALARIAGLSPGRLMHAFTESVGVPPRPYLLWLRLQRAAGAIAAGLPPGVAAHAAGFSDAAHLTRTFQRMYGAPPSVLRERSPHVQAQALPDP
ncbi:AraC family transcriptional regulator [Corallococcus sp. M34]|uniref:helix-turn-helix domain-containing protein n=1 Tax=Citreicoccus inhibens TaxID=2849499 RepID=UPI001C230FE8|nr:helix-turn-helix domain-containing protein [Citreicoccus inhibens]MBU8895542.1 AraC family transcriptional regulator [Citreicoccus inhibens]